MFLVRLVISLALLCAPLVLHVLASRKAENAILLMFPMFGAIPGAIGALLVFVPLERYLASHGLAHLTNLLVPASGASLILIFVLVVTSASRRLGTLWTRLRSGGFRAVAPLLVWSVLGVLWGAAWRASAWVIAAVAGAIRT